MLETLRRLKAETADLHAEAERHVRILDAGASDGDYARYLGRMLGFHAPMEERFAVHAGLERAGFAARTRRKAHLLSADLAACGGFPAAVATCPALPDIGPTARAVGAAYVIEGSTLGGKFILSRLPARLRRWVGVATSFLAGYGEHTGAQWRGFGAVVERVVTDRAREDQAVIGARATFTSLIDWLGGPSLAPPRPYRSLELHR